MMDINLDTPIFQEVDERKLRRKMRDDFNKRDKDTKVNTPIRKRVRRNRRSSK
jgi:hypothetical protein